jgi:hypothetical protein
MDGRTDELIRVGLGNLQFLQVNCYISYDLLSDDERHIIIWKVLAMGIAWRAKEFTYLHYSPKYFNV